MLYIFSENVIAKKVLFVKIEVSSKKLSKKMFFPPLHTSRNFTSLVLRKFSLYEDNSCLWLL